jgi:hypothetical protein
VNFASGCGLLKAIHRPRISPNNSYFRMNGWLCESRAVFMLDNPDALPRRLAWQRFHPFVFVIDDQRQPLLCQSPAHRLTAGW